MMMILEAKNPHFLLQSTKPPNDKTHSNKHKRKSIPSVTVCQCLLRNSDAGKLVHEFDPKVPVEKAVTPPSSWYTDPSFFQEELERVFYRGWQAVGCIEHIKDPGDFFTGRLGDVEFLVCRDEKGNIRAFHNVCRHHASLLVSSGTAHKASCFVCPYHELSHNAHLFHNAHLLHQSARKVVSNYNTVCNRVDAWTYGLDGQLLKATRITGIQNFNVKDFGLVPIKVATWGPFVLLNLDKEISWHEADINTVASEWLGSCSEILSTNGVDSSLSYVCRREYTIECNWKVFCDNYLDGGYHVPYAHKGLASGLQLQSYSTKMYEKVSIQSCEGGSMDRKDDYDRLGSKALYAFIYPNFMINRYGPWMDTNLVLPLGPRKCQVVFDYFLEASLKDDKAFIEKSLEDSEQVQIEDIVLCEGVQRGLESPAYSTGRYAPTVEKAMHHFHSLLHYNLTND